MSRPKRPAPARRIRGALAEFLGTEAAAGGVLLAATVVALALANSPASDWYDDVLHHQVGFTLGDVDLRESIAHWVNDALMTVFFFVVGLEIKRELVTGELRNPRRAALPVVAALGGMVVPAAIYAAWTAGTPAGDGWAVPMATDIAFALGVLALFGSRLPSSLRLFLLSLAIVDDIGAILVIALFYSDDVSGAWLAGALGVVLVVFVLRRLRVAAISAYLVPGAALWLCLFQSGVHATLAGVVLGLLTPAHPVRGRPVLETLEHRLHPWSAYMVVPVFALANAGVAVGLGEMSDAFGERLTWGVVTGLVVGKVAGVLASVAIGLRLRIGELPDDLTKPMLVGAAALAGIGFTVSLFVADLSFVPPLLDHAKLGILAASLLSGAIGASLLARTARASVVPYAARPAHGESARRAVPEG